MTSQPATKARNWRPLLRQLDPVRWELPLDAVPGMRVPGLIFADEPPVQAIAEDASVEQVANVATLPGIVGRSIAMPDIHWGYGFPIGGVAATRVSDGVVSPGGVGFDCAGCALAARAAQPARRPPSARGSAWPTMAI